MEARKLVDFPGGLELHIGVSFTLVHLETSVARLSPQQLTCSPRVCSFAVAESQSPL